jgi:hypothetical protein|eukprot:COSAG02_NODE_448_length_22102_cov_11.767032_10_plen_87_part_00
MGPIVDTNAWWLGVRVAVALNPRPAMAIGGPDRVDQLEDRAATVTQARHEQQHSHRHDARSKQLSVNNQLAWLRILFEYLCRYPSG